MRLSHGFAVAVAVLLPVPSPAQDIQFHEDVQDKCKQSWTAEKCAKFLYTDVDPFDSDELAGWKTALEGANWKQDEDCQKVKGWALDAIARADGSLTGGQREYMYWGIPKENGTTKGGSHGRDLNNGTEHLFIINDTLYKVPGPRTWEAFLHEAGHHGKLKADHSESFNAYSAQECAKLEEEEDDDDDGGGDDDGWTGGGTCTTETVWEVEWHSCSSNEGDSSCNPQCLPGVTVCVEKRLVPKEMVTCS